MLKTPLMRLAALSLGLGVAQAQNTLTLLGQGSVSDMNSTGTAVVGSDAQGAFLWTATGGYVPLGQNQGIGVSEDGTRVLGNMTDAAGDELAGLWQASTGWVSLGGLAGSSGTSVSSAYGLSGDGRRATGLGWASAASGRAFDWQEGIGMSELPRLGINSTRGNTVSRDGSTIGGWDEDATGPRRAKIWGPGGVELLILENQPGNQEGIGEVFGLSSDGTWACGTGTDEGFVWSQATGVINFGPLPGWAGGFFDRGYSNAVSDDGQRVVGWYGSFFNSAATLWTPTGGYQRLGDVLTGAGVNLGNYELISAIDISPDGRIILGEARQIGSFAREWFIATLDGAVGTAYCTPAVANSTGSGAVLTAIGSPIAASNTLTLRATGLPLNSNGYFLVSATQANTPNPAGSQGVLCLGGAIGRFLQQVQNSGQAGEFSIPVNLTSLPQPNAPVAVVAGQTWNFQCWYRDANPGLTSNFTSAVSVLFQ